MTQDLASADHMATTHRLNMGGAARMQAERDALRTRLHAASPLRSAADQRDVAHLPLFVAANEPVLL